jgi:RHS repeat-associated protein
VYLGKDILGSVRSSSNEYGVLEDRYEYDAFGKPYKGDLSQGMNLGYTGKPYDEVTGLYNYGYRDYKPEAARFTTVDPIRDGNNWFAYVNNDPVNFVDLWGLDASDKDAKTPIVILGEREKQNLAAGIPITPIQEGLYTVTDGYGPRTPVVINGRVGSDFHNGIDMAANTGTPVRSIMDGEVKTISYDDPIYGNNMVIIHNENFQTFYAHLDSIDVEQNDKVVGGQVVGKVGTTGFSTNPHLHFEYQNSNGESINPHY